MRAFERSNNRGLWVRMPKAGILAPARTAMDNELAKFFDHVDDNQLMN